MARRAKSKPSEVAAQLSFDAQFEKAIRKRKRASSRRSASTKSDGAEDKPKPRAPRVKQWKSIQAGYMTPEWELRRAEVLERDQMRCVECLRGAQHPVQLQVHHKRYEAGKMPWEYPLDDLETLCSGCHAVKHRKFPPMAGWDFIEHVDHEEVCEECDLCGTEIRYGFIVDHKDWEPMQVGTVCCDFLTGETMAMKIRKEIAKHGGRIEAFCKSDWEQTHRGLEKAPIKAVIVDQDGQFEAEAMGGPVPGRFTSIVDAQRAIFAFLHDRARQFARLRRARQKAREEHEERDDDDDRE